MIKATINHRLKLITGMQTFSWNYIKEKWQHAGFQKYFKNMGWMFSARIASMAISFIATAYIARHLGPTNYGQLSYALSFVGLFGFLAALGIDQVLYRDLIKYPEKRNEYLGSAMALKIIASVITIIVCIVSAIIWSPRDVSLFLIFLISLTFAFNSFQIIGYEFQADAKTKYPSIVSLLVVFTLNILKILVIVFGNGVIYLASIVLLEPILYMIGLVYFRVRIYGNIRNWRFKKEIAVSLLKDSSPLIFSSAFAAIYARIDQVMIKNMMNTESVGLYDAAVRISEVWYFIPSIIVGSLFPAILNTKKISDKLYYERIRKLFIVVLIIAIGTSLLTTLFSKELVHIIFGAGFIGAVTVLQIYVWSNVWAALNNLTNFLLIAENLRKVILISSLLGMITNVVLNIYLIPIYGMVGAAFATLFSYGMPFLVVILVQKTRRVIWGN